MSATTILLINCICIALMLELAILLGSTSRMKGGVGIACTIIIFTTIPVYIFNMTRSIGAWDIAAIFIYFSGTVNTMLMPLLWLFVLSQLEPAFRFKPSMLLHFIPTLAMLVFSIVFFSPLSRTEFISAISKEAMGEDTIVSAVNSYIILLQVIIYFTMIFIFIKKAKNNYLNSYSDTEFASYRWVSKLCFVFGAFFVIVMAAYMIYPRSDVWLIPIINVALMSYMTYLIIYNPMKKYFLPEEETSGIVQTVITKTPLSEEEMKNYCRIIIDYISSSEAYKKPDFSLRQLVDATGISENNISRSINGYLGKNFFTLINGIRLERVKQLLLKSNISEYTIDGIAAESGFRSRSTFYLVFKKEIGETPSKWLKMEQNKS